MKLPTSYLPEKIRSAVRFMVVGFTGSVLQTWLFMAWLFLFGHPEKGVPLYYVAFTLGLVMEMIPNYLFTSWYTFATKPSWKNAGGFLLARAVNVPLQLGLLPLFIWLFPSWRDDYLSLLVIFIAGCVNYLICLLFFKQKPKEPQESE